MINRMNQILDDLAPLVDKIDWSREDVYANWLSQAFYIARQSTSFLGLTMIHSAKHPEFLARCTDHIGEETGHEKLIMNDLKHLGFKLMPELPSTSGVYQTQYYRIVVQSPLSFVGYVFFLELLAPRFCPGIMEQVPNKKALSFVKVHTAADEDHIEEAAKLLDMMNQEELEMVWSNYEMTAAAYKRMLEVLYEMQEANIRHQKSA